MEDKTLSEDLFEQFCESAKIPCERIMRSNREKRPDYKITFDSTDVYVEVKELGDNDNEKQLRANLEGTGFASGTGLGVITHGDQRVRKQITKAIPQLKKAADSGAPTVVVLHDSQSLFKIGALEIRLGMFGQDVLDTNLQHHFGRGQKVGRAHNRSLSAVGLLIAEAADLRLQLFLNHFAKSPLQKILRPPFLSQFQLGGIGRGGLPEWAELRDENQSS